MEKNEKLKVLVAVAESLGLTAKEVVAYFGKASAQSEEVVSTDVVRPGMYYYSDETISAEVLLTKQISGVVGWVDESGRHGLVLGVRETKLPWSSDCLRVNLPENTDGRKNTRLILKAVHKQNKKAEAAEWCAAYAFDGIHAGEAFLPSKAELVKIFKSFDAIQNALKKINQPRLKKEGWHWSSSESSGYTAWYVRPSDGAMYYGSYYGTKYTSNRVRCAWKFVVRGRPGFLFVYFVVDIMEVVI